MSLFATEIVFDNAKKVTCYNDKNEFNLAIFETRSFQDLSISFKTKLDEAKDKKLKEFNFSELYKYNKYEISAFYVALRVDKISYSCENNFEKTKLTIYP